MSNAYSQQTRARGAQNPNPNRFSMVPSVEQQRSNFDRSHQYKTTMDAGYLVPYFVDEVLPGDTFTLNSTLLARLATPIVPIMDNLYLETFFFFVPNRLVWGNFEKFMGAQANPDDSTDYLVPTLEGDNAPLNFGTGSIADYFGIPTGVDIPATEQINALPFRAYNLVWNEWFRDQNLQNSVDVPTGDGPDLADDYKLLRRGKRHDYFTSCLPWPQKGPGVELPLGSTAPLVFDPIGNPTGIYFEHNGNPVLSSTGDLHTVNGVNTVQVNPGGTNQLAFDVSNSHVVDLSDATAATINSLRQAFQLQRMLERDARGGTRYIEILKSHFGVTSPDYRLQRPEYLGGGSARVNIHPVAQQSSTDDTSPQAHLAAIGVAASDRNGFTKSFTEHGIIIGLVNVRADLTYQQGLSRMWSRKTKYDYYWPALAHLGEQAVLNKEIYYKTNNEAINNAVFGYQERWSEYRYFPSKVTGRFRSQDSASLDVWHLAQEFSDTPALSAEFIEDNPPIDRVVATPEEPQILLDVYNALQTSRVMPTYSVPGLIDHF